MCQKSWKLKGSEWGEIFRDEIRQALEGVEELPDDWKTTAVLVRETAVKVLGITSHQKKRDKKHGGGMRRSRRAQRTKDWQKRNGTCRKMKKANRNTRRCGVR